MYGAIHARQWWGHDQRAGVTGVPAPGALPVKAPRLDRHMCPRLQVTWVVRVMVLHL